jgi:hypothetical protein
MRDYRAPQQDRALLWQKGCHPRPAKGSADPDPVARRERYLTMVLGDGKIGAGTPEACLSSPAALMSRER